MPDRNLTIHPTTTPNSLTNWYRIINPFKVTFNFIIIYTCKYIPFLSLKRTLLRTTGMKIGKDASIGLAATFDIFFPELINIDENTIIGYNTTILAHEFLIGEYRTGNVKIGKGCMIGANTTILAGTTIGDNTTISAMTLVNKDVKKESFIGGVPFRYLKKHTEE